MDAHGNPAAAETVAPPHRIFINYRREESAGDARALYNVLISRYGAEKIFLDVSSLRPGSNWLDEIKSHEGGDGVFLSLIGPRWLQILQERSQARIVDPGEDFVTYEIEAALGGDSAVRVVPVLIDDALMPDPDELPPSLGELTRIQAAHLRHTRWEDDVEHLLEQIESLSQIPRSLAPVRLPPTPRPVASPPSSPTPARVAAPAPDASHYEELITLMVEQGNVVPLLGSRVNAGDRDGVWQQGASFLPDSDELAGVLARRFSFGDEPVDLARVTQHVYTRLGKPDLCKALKEILSPDANPGSIHRFLAGFPSMLKQLGLRRRYMLIVTTNYDNALERAFDEAKEPYDLAVYLASGDQPGKFLHIPYNNDTPNVIGIPNDYTEFPIGDSFDLSRTVIVKIHGAVDGARGSVQWRDNYVITEDHYIDYLSRSPVENLIPVQILEKIRDSHCLFLGYSMRDWSLRVFLKRVWKGDRLNSSSWAVERDADMLEKKFWADLGVDLYAAPLAKYVAQLGKHLAAVPAPAG
jgi:hypothetical protein